jgi:hypothetical protein
VEKRKDAKVAREWEVALPAELDELGRIYLIRNFANELVKRYGVAVDACIHAPGKRGDDRNFHAHVLTSTRVLTPNGFGEKTRILDSPRTSGQEVTAIRELWASQCNTALAQKGLDEHVDHRSLKVQGIDREPTKHLGVAASSMERRGVRSLRGDENRRRRDPRIDRELKELKVLQNVERGIEASRLRHERRKDRAEWEAELLRQAKKERRFTVERERAENRRGMER